MASIFDVSAFILDRMGATSAMKLQKLAYYSLAWHSVWSDEQLFPEHFEAWANGPVSPDLYHYHRGRFLIAPGDLPGDKTALTEDQADSVDRVLNAYGDKSSQWLSDLTHMESPWREARQGIPDGERCNVPIPLASIAEYYTSI